MRDITLGDMIGSGAFGDAFTARFRGTPVVVKKIRTTAKFSREARKMFGFEAAVMW